MAIDSRQVAAEVTIPISARPELAFPELTVEMRCRIMAYGTTQGYGPLQLLWTRGQRDVDLFVVLEGQVEIASQDEEESRRIVGRLHPGHFSGELDLLNSRHTLVSGFTLTECRLLRIDRVGLKRLLKAEGDIANLIIQAAIWRRLAMLHEVTANIALVGEGTSTETLTLQTFLSRNGYPYRLIEPSAEGTVVCEWLSAGDMRLALPAVVFPDGKILQRPSTLSLGDELGLIELVPAGQIFDVVVVGAGPAGLASAVYAASEGLSTAIVDGIGPGGQACTSSKIENYLGFPTGVSGQELATRAQAQAQKFGARLFVSREVRAIQCVGQLKRVELSDGSALNARSVIIATGARYRQLGAQRDSSFVGNGIHYAATAIEATLCRGQQIAIVGGGNSAGQAALYLAGFAAHVHLIVRSEVLAASMSEYLVSRIASSPKITVHPHSEIASIHGSAKVLGITWNDHGTRSSHHCPITQIFVMIGAVPNSDWLEGFIELDAKGFVKTGDADGSSPRFESSTEGIFAVGDVREGSTKRVAAAVGEGASVVGEIHDYLNSLTSQPSKAQI